MAFSLTSSSARPLKTLGLGYPDNLQHVEADGTDVNPKNMALFSV